MQKVLVLSLPSYELCGCSHLSSQPSAVLLQSEFWVCLSGHGVLEAFSGRGLSLICRQTWAAVLSNFTCPSMEHGPSLT